jgi:hypothetical protein
MIAELSIRIWQNKQFHADVAKLRLELAKKKYIDSETPSLEYEVLQRLLKSAAILSCSTDLNHREAAYQIASAASELEYSLFPNVAYILLVVLSRIGNFPALEYARKRYLITEDALPVRSVAEAASRSANNSVQIGDKNVALTDFQLDLWSKLNLGESFGVSAPTSAGKSFILQAYAKRMIHEGRADNIAFLVPTRALINQVSDEISNWLVNTDIGAELITTPIPRDTNLPTKAVYVVTQERLQLLQSAHAKLIFDLIVVDEAQSIADGPRGVLLSSVIDESLIRNPSLQILFAGPNLKDPGKISRLFGKKDSSVSTTEATVIQNIVFVDCDDARPEYASISIRSNKEKISIGKVNFDQPLVTHEGKLVNIALKLGGSGQSLIYALGPAECETIAVALADDDNAIIDPELEELSEFIKEAVHPKYQLAKTVKNGVGFHYGRLPTLVRKAIEDAFSSGKLRFLVTTSTLLYGVNLPAQNLFLHNPQRGENQPISSNDFWNLAGRAGRLGKEFSGNIFLVDYADWATDPMSGVKDREVLPAIQEHLVSRQQELLDYIRNPEAVPARNKADELENTFVKLVRDHLNGRLLDTLSKVGLDPTAKSSVDLVEAIQESLIGKNIDGEVMMASPTVSIHRQQSLYEWLEKSLKKKGPEYIIPKHPKDSNAYNSYLAAIKRCHGAILKYPKPDNSHRYYAQLALKWMRGDPLPQIIDAKVDHNAKIKKKSGMPTVIRETLTEIETDMRFKYVRLFSCYNAVLEAVLRDNGMAHLTSSIPSIPMYLELGACSTSMISFMGLGLSRYTASKVSSIPRRADMSQLEAKNWLKRQEIDALNIPVASVNEIRRLGLVLTQPPDPGHL